MAVPAAVDWMVAACELPLTIVTNEAPDVAVQANVPPPGFGFAVNWIELGPCVPALRSGTLLGPEIVTLGVTVPGEVGAKVEVGQPVLLL